MSLPCVTLLHVEDDPMQQRMIAHHLKAIPEHSFAITAVASEELAMECFQKTKIDVVLLDYQLEKGNGMHLLGRLRKLDPIVPIIAISGVATSEIAAELVQAGADDYFNKRDLNSAGLATSIRSSLRRADAVRKTLADRAVGTVNHLTPQLTKFYAEYAARIGPDFLAQLDVIAHDMKHACISAEELQRIHEDALSQIKDDAGLDQDRTKQLLRPLLLELLGRVFEGA
jgi:DNA-binding response OmpR family regulator